MRPHKARCVHGAPWFAACGWCKSDDTRIVRRGDAIYGWTPSREVFWRNIIARDEKARMVQTLIDNALDTWEERMLRKEEECQNHK